MILLIPESGGRPLVEFNPNHIKAGSTTGGQFAKKDGGAAAGGPPARPIPRLVHNIDEAVERVLKGEVVELTSVRHANTVLTKLAAMALEAKRLGKEAPNYDLCKVTVKGTNLFCASKVVDAENPDGIPRIKMPQLGAHVEAFINHLENEMGIKVTRETEKADQLKASQSELVGPKVAGMMTNPDFDPAGESIFVSRDNYVVDGHHRWAAMVGLDAKDGHLGDLKMGVLRIDAPISEVLQIANRWTKKMGIAGAAGPKGK